MKGWNPQQKEWVERIYYAGGAYQLWGPYAIGYLEWDGNAWIDQPAPVFTANEAWEHGSVYEPNVLFHDGKWKLWYVSGSNWEDYLIHGYAESDEGSTNWTRHKIFAPWKPAIRYTDQGKLLVFFDGLRQTSEPDPFSLAFTLGCLELDRRVSTGH